MKLELDYFYIGQAYGGKQTWFSDEWMRRGGCAAVTACDCSIYFSLFRKKNLYPYNVNQVMREDYIRFSKNMKPYLRPRMSGIDRLDLYIDGFGKYLTDKGEEKLKMTAWEGERCIADTQIAVKRQIDEGFPIPCLVLKHMNPVFQDYVWHWFLLTGYEKLEDTFMVKVVTYGSWCWLRLDELWNTGYERKGGLVLFYE
ncbi:MAG: hypothetical protein WCS30_03205 [Selenomonadaceae bacterium]